MNLYERIQSICKEKNTSVNALEQELGFCRSSIFKWSTSVPSVEKVKKVADHFGMTVDELIKECDE